MIVVLDASTFVSAALKADSVPERALFRAVTEPNRLILSREVEEGRGGARLLAPLRGRGDVAMTTDAIMALTRND